MKIVLLGSGSIAVSSHGVDWVLINASPDLAQQLQTAAALQAWNGSRGHKTIRAVVLTNAHIDHVTGLLSLRDGPPLELYCTPLVFEDLTSGLPMLPALQHYCGLHWHLLPIAGDENAAAFEVPTCPDLHFHAIAVGGKAPPYSTQADDTAVGHHIALLIENKLNGKQVFYAPTLADVRPPEREWMSRASCLVVDGRLCSNDAIHAELAPLPARRKVLVEADAELNLLAAQGIEVGFDGMEFEL